MTIREEYEKMKKELRIWNKRSNWDNTKYKYHLEHHSKRAKTEFLKLLNKDFDSMNFDVEYKIITVDEYNRLWKVWNDCSTSIAGMEIF